MSRPTATPLPEPSEGTSPATETGTAGLQAVLALPEFRRLWLGQVFSQLADKFYIVLMVFLIAQYWVTDTPRTTWFWPRRRPVCGLIWTPEPR